jgi:hypothetical protein
MGRCGHHLLRIDRGQLAEGGLASAAVVGAFDPGDDRDPRLFAGVLATAVQDVLLQQAEEAPTADRARLLAGRSGFTSSGLITDANSDFI